jgi:transcriptional regulator with XRE-family HTH domain
MIKKPHTRWGGLIAARRRQAGLSQADLAARIGVRRATVSSWEADRASPRGHKMTALTEALSLTADELGNAILAEETDPRVDQG